MEQEATNKSNLGPLQKLTDRDEALTLYTTFVGTITANEQRRAQISTIYLSVFAGGGASFGALKLDFIYAAVPAIFVALVWLQSIRYFRRLAKAKFKVVEELEQQFDYEPFKREWFFYKGTVDPDVDAKKFLGLAHLDMMVPAFLAMLSIGFVIYRIVAAFC